MGFEAGAAVLGDVLGGSAAADVAATAAADVVGSAAIGGGAAAGMGLADMAGMGAVDYSLLGGGATIPSLGMGAGADALSVYGAGGLAGAGYTPLGTMATGGGLSGAAMTGAGAGGLMGTLGTIGQVGQAVAPWAGMAQSAYQMANAGNYATMADPFRMQRPLYQGMLQNLMTNPSAIQMDPSYQWRMGQGIETVNRGAARSGQLGSGNRLTDLMTYGQGLASTEYGNQFNRLMQLSGAQTGQPAMAAQAAYQIPQAGLSNIFTQMGNVASPQYQQNLSSLWS